MNASSLCQFSNNRDSLYINKNKTNQIVSKYDIFKLSLSKNTNIVLGVILNEDKEEKGYVLMVQNILNPLILRGILHIDILIKL